MGVITLHGETPLVDQVQAIGRVVAVKDDLAACEAAPARHGQEPFGLCFGNTCQQPEAHSSIMAPGRPYVSTATDGMFPT